MENNISREISERRKTQPELPKIKIFKTVRKYFAIMGITPVLVDQSYPFNLGIIFGYLLFGSAITSLFIFIIFEAETFWEFSQSIFTCSAMILGICCLLILVFRVRILFKFIASFENVINTSEYESP